MSIREIHAARGARRGAAERPGLRLSRRTCDAVIFDMDGVVTDTADVHARAWKDTFDEFLARRAREASGALAPFDLVDDYRLHVDGVSRDDGVRRFLASRGIALEEGRRGGPPERDTVIGIGERKNRRFLEVLRRDGARRFDDALDLVDRLRHAGIHTAVVSASCNAEEVLAAAGVADRFEARVDGVVQRERGLRGKPAPDLFVEAARRLGARPDRCAIVEDALAGVEAGRAGGFAWVIAVARNGNAERLARAGADVVVSDLGEIVVAGDGA